MRFCPLAIVSGYSAVYALLYPMCATNTITKHLIKEVNIVQYSFDKSHNIVIKYNIKCDYID